MLPNKKMLIVKSEKLNILQQQYFNQQHIEVNYLHLLKFEYCQLHMDNVEYDYICFNSPNGVESYLRSQSKQKCSNFLVVGQKTAEKLQIVNPLTLQIFQNQQQLSSFAMTLPKGLNILYILGNLSEIEKELLEFHNITTLIGYHTVSNMELNVNDINFGSFDYITYFSNSNYNSFKQLNLELKSTVMHIFIGKKCGQNTEEQNSIKLTSPDELYQLIL